MAQDTSNLGLPVNAPEVSGGSQTQNMLDALKSGKTKLTVGPDAPTTSSDDSTQESVESQEQNDVDKSKFDPSTFLDSLGSDEEDSDSQDAPSSKSKDSKPSKKVKAEDIEEITVTGPEGRRRVKVDYTDREAIKRDKSLAYGARKWQKERDEYKAKVEKLEPIQNEYNSLKSDWQKIEQAYSKSGYKGLIDLIEGKQGAWKEALKQASAEQERFDSMPASERAKLEYEQREQESREREDRVRKEYEAKLQEINKKQEQAEYRTIESKLIPSFDRYRFRGTLGDEVAETEFDEMLWNRTLSQLEKLPDDVELTQALVDKEFRRIAQTMRKHVNTQVETKVKQSIDKTKKKAVEKAQTVVKRSMRNSSEVEEFKQNMKSGNLVDGLASFFKAGGKFR